MMKNWQRLFGLMPPAVLLAALGTADVSLGATTPQVKAGESHTVMLRSNGTLWTCGDNFLGQLGDGTTTASNVPIRIGTATDWVAISAGQFHTLAIKADGSLWAWGDNTYGQLGIGTTDLVHPLPVQVGAETNWDKISAGDYHTVAMKKDGTIWAWGDSADGTLGTGETYSGIIVPTPTQIGTDKWKAIATGRGHTMAVRADGVLFGFGANGVGQLGDQTNLEGRNPIQIGVDTDWADVTVRGDQTVARKTNNKLFTWGENADGQLGDGTLANKDLPTKVDDAAWAAIASGNGHTVALKDDGSLWAWGDNAEGQCGGGDAEVGKSRVRPLQISTAKDFVAIDAGEAHTVAMKANGTIWAIGDNTLGQLCNGTNTAKTSPTPGISPTSGDIDLDGDVTVTDAVRALRVGIGLATSSPADVISGDVGPLVGGTPTPDGVVTLGDAVVILRKVVKLVSY
jgi:alpha-tubulin suppressor-like RCC1 family protein